MRSIRAKWLVAALAAALLLVALAPLAVRWSHETAWRVPAGDKALVDRTLRGGAAAFGTTEEAYRRRTRPVVIRSADTICVLLASPFHDGGGSHKACYEADGRERSSGRGLGGYRLADRLRELVW